MEASADVNLRNSPGRRVLAGALSLAGAGLGQVVAGHPVRGYKWCAGLLAMPLALAAVASAGFRYLVGPLFIALVLLRLAASVDAVLLRSKVVRWGALKTALVVVALVAVQQVLVQAIPLLVRSYTVPTAAMYPTMQPGEHIVASLLPASPKRGNVVVFDNPSDDRVQYMSRVVAVEGDTVEMRNGRLILNGQETALEATDEPCFIGEPCTIWRETLDGRTYRIALLDSADGLPLRDRRPSVVPAGYVFLLGDSRDNSQDSRILGPIPAANIVGSPSFVYWSSDETGIRWDRINQVIE